MDYRITQRQSDRISSMLRDDWRQTALNFCECFFPSGFHEAAVSLDQRFAQAVRIFMQIFECYAFRTQIAAAEDVGSVSANAFTRPSATVISRPQQASQKGQIRWWTVS